MATLLINNITAPPISITNFNIHNPNGVDAALLKNLLEVNFNNIVCKKKIKNTLQNEKIHRHLEFSELMLRTLFDQTLVGLKGATLVLGLILETI